MNPKSKQVALIDDDDGPIRYYEIALDAAGYEVIRLKTFKAALDFIGTYSNEPDFWIIDVMMSIGNDSISPTGVDLADETKYGLAAGIYLYREIRKQKAIAPALLLTSVTTPSLLNDIEETLQDGDTCEAKLDLVPSKLVSLVNLRSNSTT